MLGRDVYDDRAVLERPRSRTAITGVINDCSSVVVVKSQKSVTTFVGADYLRLQQAARRTVRSGGHCTCERRHYRTCCNRREPADNLRNAHCLSQVAGPAAGPLPTASRLALGPSDQPANPATTTGVGLLIGGGAGSGKTALARALADAVPGPALVHLDSCYHRDPDLAPSVPRFDGPGRVVDFSDPLALDSARIKP